LKEQQATGISRLKEIELINKCKKDIGNFKPLYEAHFPQILNYVFQKVSDREMAADITSQVFLKAMLHLRTYRVQAAPFSAWLYKIAYNETMLYFRKSKGERTIVLDEALVDGLKEELDEFPREMILKLIEGMISKLDHDDFELIELRFYQNRSFREIGFILGCSENTVKVRAHRLIRRMTQELLK
jgi:RNA polymerase sigma-70 factor (ECF subfamily)